MTDHLHEGTKVPLGTAAKVAIFIVAVVLQAAGVYSVLSDADAQTNARIDKLELTTDLTLKRDLDSLKSDTQDIKQLLADLKEGMNDQSDINRALRRDVDELRGIRRRGSSPVHPADSP